VRPFGPLDPARVASLPAPDRDMLCLYYGLDQQRPHTLREIGARYRVAYWRVEAIITRAVARLLEPAES
jgi:DNA-directed RNA polymerase sigma subunit (sigma70/sigma32)